MSAEAVQQGASTVTLRRVEGPICAVCGVDIGLITVNGKSVLVETRLVCAGDTLLFVLHRCPVAGRASEPQPRRRRR